MKTLDYSATMEGDIYNAIKDSVRLRRTITVEPVTELIDYAVGLGDGSATENDGSTDVWGTDDNGNEWRLLIAKPDYTDDLCEQLASEARKAGDHKMARACRVALGRIAGDRAAAVLIVAAALRTARSNRDD